MVRATVIVFVLATPLTLIAQNQRTESAAPPSACWRFAFGSWTPPLDWAGAGQPGSDSGTAAIVQRVRDSIYAGDPVASRNSAMTIEQTSSGMLVMLYPAWWPAGVKLTFDSTLAGGREMIGTAIALTANGSVAPSQARARAQQVACGGRDRS